MCSSDLAASIPAEMPKIQVRREADSASLQVLGKTSARMSATGRFWDRETPRSPCRMPTGQPRPVLISLLEPRQIVQLKAYLKEKDPNAFVSICDATEVLGQGFKSWKSL